MQDLSKVLHKLATTKPVDDGQYIPPVSHGEGDKECNAVSYTHLTLPTKA